MIWGDMRVMIRDLVGDIERSGGQANRYNPRQLADSINHAMKIYAKKTQCTHTVAPSLAISSNSVVSAATLRVLEPLGVIWNSKNVDKTFETFERQKDPNYRSGTGTAYTRWFMDTGQNILLLPATSTALTPSTIKFLYLETPQEITAITADATELDARIPASDQEHLRFLAAAYLKKLLGDANDNKLADSWVQMFLALTGGK